MNRIKLKNFILLILFLSTLWIFQKCARPGTPTGGPKDEEGPLLLFTYPKQLEKSFIDDKLVLVFNEWVKLNNVKKELIITPTIEGNFTSKNKKNEIHITNLQLDKNTTYTFSFRESVVDITENNHPEDLELIFSTGNEIDSLTISGVVTNSKLKNSKLVVGLYLDVDSLNLFTEKPKYMINVDTVNNFLFKYLKPDTYKIYAFTDYNDNNICDSKKESYAFINEILTLDKNIDSLKLVLTKNNLDSLKILGSKKTGKYYEILFNKSIDSLYANSEDSILYQIIDDKKKLRLYNVYNDTLIRDIKIKLFDSIGNKKDSLISFQFAQKSKLEDTFQMQTKKYEIDENRKSNIIFTFNKPVDILLSDSLGIYLDSTKLEIEAKKIWNYNHTKLIVEHNFEIDSLFQHFITDESIEDDENIKKIEMPKIQYYVPKGTFISIDKDSSDFKSIELKILNPEDKAYISGEIECNADSLVFELIKNKKVIRKLVHEKNFEFRYLDPGTYTFRYFVDKNKNGKIDRGNYLKKILPEEYVILKKGYEMRKSWGLEKQIIACDNIDFDEENDVEN